MSFTAFSFPVRCRDALLLLSNLCEQSVEEPGNGQARCFRAECIQSQKARGSQADELRHLALTLTAKLLEPLSCNATICHNATSAGKLLRVTRGLHLLSLGPARAQSCQAAGTALLHCTAALLYCCTTTVFSSALLALCHTWLGTEANLSLRPFVASSRSRCALQEPTERMLFSQFITSPGRGIACRSHGSMGR